MSYPPHHAGEAIRAVGGCGAIGKKEDGTATACLLPIGHGPHGWDIDERQRAENAEAERDRYRAVLEQIGGGVCAWCSTAAYSKASEIAGGEHYNTCPIGNALLRSTPLPVASADVVLSGILAVDGDAATPELSHVAIFTRRVRFKEKEERVLRFAEFVISPEEARELGPHLGETFRLEVRR